MTPNHQTATILRRAAEGLRDPKRVVLNAARRLRGEDAA